MCLLSVESGKSPKITQTEKIHLIPNENVDIISTDYEDRTNIQLSNISVPWLDVGHKEILYLQIKKRNINLLIMLCLKCKPRCTLETQWRSGDVVSSLPTENMVRRTCRDLCF